MNVREKQDICIADDLSLVSAVLVLCCRGIDSQIHGERSVYDTILDAAFLIPLSQLCCLYGDRHLFIDHFYSGKRCYLGHLHAAGLCHFYGIVNNGLFIFQGRIRHECYVC